MNGIGRDGEDRGDGIDGEDDVGGFDRKSTTKSGVAPSRPSWREKTGCLVAVGHGEEAPEPADDPVLLRVVSPLSCASSRGP